MADFGYLDQRRNRQSISSIEKSVQFPSTLTESERFFVQFDIFKLATPLENIEGSLMDTILHASPTVVANLADKLSDIHGTFDYSQTADQLLYSIQLPLQEAPAESSTLEYNDESTKTMQNIGTAIQGIRGAAGDAGEGSFADKAKNIISSIVKGAGGVVEAEAMKLIPEVAQAMYGRLRGKVKNTMQQTFFVGPSKKDYQFTFDLIARNRKDSEAMSTIANRFQYFSNPGLSGQGNFWTYPEVVRYFFMERVGDDFRQIDVLSSLGNGVKNKVYESKACFITSVSIEYGDDDYLLFSSKDGGRGVGKMKLTLALKEVEYFSKEDYRRSTDPEI